MTNQKIQLCRKSVKRKNQCLGCVFFLFSSWLFIYQSLQSIMEEGRQKHHIVYWTNPSHSPKLLSINILCHSMFCSKNNHIVFYLFYWRTTINSHYKLHLKEWKKQKSILMVITLRIHIPVTKLYRFKSEEKSVHQSNWRHFHLADDTELFR